MKKFKVAAFDAEVYQALSDPVVFADLFNGSVFHGEQVLRPDMLQPANEKEQLLAENRIGGPAVLYRIRDLSRNGVFPEGLLRVVLSVEGQRDLYLSFLSTQKQKEEAQPSRVTPLRTLYTHFFLFPIKCRAVSYTHLFGRDHVLWGEPLLHQRGQHHHDGPCPAQERQLRRDRELGCGNQPRIPHQPPLADECQL